MHFTTPQLKKIGESLKALESTYKAQQTELVKKAIETASSYTPLVEQASALVSELDVLTSFATTAAISPHAYVRPTLLPRGSGVLKCYGARHPCVELMDDIQFIPNDYELARCNSNFQIITGPNMVRTNSILLNSVILMSNSYVESIVSLTFTRVGSQPIFVD